MYVAFSEVLHDIVNINDAYDLNEVFRCPNVNCTAKMKIRGTTGKRAKHFARLPSTPHIKGCDYENGDSRFVQPDLQKRSTIEDIFGDLLNPNTHGERPRSKRKSISGSSNILHINTPKKLLKFCRMNSLDTEYLPGVTVDDILVEERNLIQDGKFNGVDGLRIVVGKTVKYEGEMLYLLVTATSKHGKQVKLKGRVKMDTDLLRYVRKHIIETQGKFGGYTIAVFGKWKIEGKYSISCEVFSQKHIMLRF